MYKLKFLILSLGCLLLAPEVLAQTCTTAPSCAELGYTQTVAQCTGKNMVKCPFDKAQVFCGISQSCAELGFTLTKTDCAGRHAVACPYDSSKYACDNGAIIGEIKLWAGKTVPNGWKICDGSSLSTTTYKALYDVIGTSFGGSSSYFYLPNFRGRVPVGIGYATSSTYSYSMGSKGGEEKHTLTVNEMPSHRHWHVNITPNDENKSSSQGYPANNNHNSVRTTDRTAGYSGAHTNYQGGGAAHENRMPYLAVYYIIYTGVYSTPTTWECPMCANVNTFGSGTKHECPICGYIYEK